MAEIERVLNNLTKRELDEASNCATRSTIKMRVLLKIADMLGLSLQSIYDTKSLIRVDVSISNFIEKTWKHYYNASRVGGRNSMKPSHAASANTHTSASANNNCSSLPTLDEWSAIERFLAKDFARNVDLIRLTGVLKKRLPEKDLNFIFAADGLHSVDATETNHHTVNDYRNYFENLSVPLDRVSVCCDRKTKDGEEETDDDEDYREPIAWTHVSAVRDIYKRVKDATPDKIGKVLKKIYETLEHGDSVLSSKTMQSEESSDGSDSESEDGDETDSDRVSVEEQIEKIYRRVVGERLADIASLKKIEMERAMSRESSRKRKHDCCNEGEGERRNKPGRPPRKNKSNDADEKRTDGEVREKMGNEEKSGSENEVSESTVSEMDLDETDSINADRVREKKNMNVVIIKKKKVLENNDEYAVAPPKKKRTSDK